MKRTAFILLLIAAVASPILAKSTFKQGNDKYFSGDYDAALQDYSKFIQNNKKKYEGYYNAGNALFRQEKYEDALNMYNKALELNPKDEDTKYNIEVTQERIKNQPKDKNKQDQNKQDNKQQQNNQNGQGKQDGQGQNKQQDKNQQGKGDKQNQQGDKGKGGQQQSAQGSGGKSEEQKQAEEQAKAATEQKARSEQAQKSLGMSQDEIQAVLNNYNKQEKQYRQYFGQQNRPRQDDMSMPNFFNMSPQEIMDYMEKRSMMQPYGNEQQKKNPNEKDW